MDGYIMQHKGCLNLYLEHFQVILRTFILDNECKQQRRETTLLLPLEHGKKIEIFVFLIFCFILGLNLANKTKREVGTNEMKGRVRICCWIG